MSITDTSVIPAEVNNFYSRALLERAVPLFTYAKFAQIRDIERNSGTTVAKFRRYGNLAAATTPLTEGVTPSGSQLSTTEITAEALEYGDFITMSNTLLYQTIDPILLETARILGDQMSDTIDQLTRDVLAAGTSVLYGGNATARANVDATDLIDATVLRKANRLLKNNKARRITEMIDATTGIDTTPVAPAYIAFVSPNTEFTLRTITGYTPVEKYSMTGKLYEGEIGKFEDIRFIETTNAKVFTGAGAAGIDVYATIIIGANAYGITRISGEEVSNIVKPLGSAGTADPLNQRATSGWLITHVAKILNNDFMTRIEHAVAS